MHKKAWASCTMSTAQRALGSSLILGLFWMFLARLAYRSVLSVSSWLQAAGPTLAIMTVRVLPPSESCSRRVSLESRYGMCPLLPSTCAAVTGKCTGLRLTTFVSNFVQPRWDACGSDCNHRPFAQATS